MKIALVYDHVNKIGGAERILEVLHEIYPEAPLYTYVYDFKKAPWAKKFNVITSFAQKIPFIKSRHELLPVIPIFAFEHFDFSNFDIVISITSAEAKGIITGPQTLHICYCLTPTRYLWSHYDDYFQGLFKLISLPIVFLVRKWDIIASKRPNIIIAISENVKQRIAKYYSRKSVIIYPPVNTEQFCPKKNHNKGKYYLLVSRFVGYKHIEIAIEACNSLQLPLIVIGSGKEKNKLTKIAGETIQFVNNLTDMQLIEYYQNCRAFIFPQEEDFGISAVEAMACGRPVIAYKKGGALEIVVAGKTGEFFDQHNSQSLIKTIKIFETRNYDINECRLQALKFSKQKFKVNFMKFIQKKYNLFKKEQKI